MSNYTKLNLERDVENSAEKFGMGDVLEAHFAREDLDATQSGLSLQRLKPNQRMPFGHTHNQQEEVYVIAGGSGRLKLDDEVLEVGQWDAIRIAPNVMRAIEAGPGRPRPGRVRRAQRRPRRRQSRNGLVGRD